MKLNNIKFTQETLMTTNDLKILIQRHPKETVSQEYSLFERSLVNETSTFLRNVESTAKRVKKGKVTLIAVIHD